MKKKFNVLNDNELNKFKTNIASIVTEDKRIEVIYRNILDSRINEEKNHDYVISKMIEPFKMTLNQPLNKKAIQDLDAKLKFKLGWIISNLRKLTNACDKKFLNDSSQFEFLTKTLLNHLNEKSIDNKNDDEIELELELLGLASVDIDADDHYDKSNDVDYDINKDASAVSFNSEKINQWNFFNSFKDFDDSDFSSSSSYQSPLHQSSTLAKDYNDKLNKYYQFNSILIDHGRNLSEKENSQLIDYTEDIAGSIEHEIQSKIDELRIDFPLIDKFIKELRMIIAKEWIGKYGEDLKNNKDGSLHIIKTNETDEK